VQGHARIKMSTSIIDYLFRELAITYLGRNDLAHVNPEALRHDALHEGDEPNWSEEEDVGAHNVMIAKRAIDVDAAPAVGVGVAGAKARPRVDARTAAIRDAKAQGYEGDACTDCHQFTMVRNGACLKCMSCGATSGCS
jgi:ribonucleoside-diphosphate reductase alpha chain